MIISPRYIPAPRFVLYFAFAFPSGPRISSPTGTKAIYAEPSPLGMTTTVTNRIKTR